MPKVLYVDQIEHCDLEDNIPRRIAVVDNMVLYQSSGTDSTFPKTWFPTFGIFNIHNKEVVKSYFPNVFLPTYEDPLWLLKPTHQYLPVNVRAQIQLIFTDNPQVENFMGRMGSLPALLISSLLCSGIWKEAEGILLKNFLKVEYSFFYDTFSKICLSAQCPRISESEIVNRWILTKLKLQNLQAVYENSPKYLSDLLPNPPMLIPFYLRRKKVYFNEDSESPEVLTASSSTESLTTNGSPSFNRRRLHCFD